MKKPVSHPILAFFFDFYFVALMGMGIIVLLNSLTHTVILSYMVFMVIFLSILAFIILYHAWLNKKTRFLSYGELATGKIYKKGKEWHNPYSKNRFFLFFVIVVSLLLLGNTWDTVVFMVPKLTFVIGSFVKIILVFWGIYLIGRGKIWGAFVSMTPFLLGSIFSFLMFKAAGAVALLILSIIFMVITIGYVAVDYVYRK